MTDCSERFRELTHAQEVVLDEDLAGLRRMSEQSRIERYNGLRADEEAFRWEFSRECPDFLTSAETDRIRGRYKLARLLLAASFHADGEVPRAMADDFTEAELQAVVDFDRYKQFDALSEEQIEERIRRMEGEVYELVQEYTSTQLANLEALLENPDVQRDVMERLVARYEDRREKIRRGFFVYVETRGLEEMVATIEDAVRSVAEAADERERIRETRREELGELAASLDATVRSRRQELESQVRSVEGRLADRAVSAEELRAELAALRERADEFSGARTDALSELDDRIERTGEMERRLDARIDELEAARERAASADRERAVDEVTDLIRDELSELRAERDDLRAEVEQLRREREGIERARDRLEERQEALESRVTDLETSTGSADDGPAGGLPGENVVTAAIARLLELDYLGRFDISMHEVETLHTPDGSFEVPDGFWDGRSERRSERTRLREWLDEDDDPDRYPTNQRARYEVTESRYLGLSEERRMVVEAVVHSHLEAHATNGFDARPADLDDLVELVNETVSEAEAGEYAHLLAVASPTGWTDRVRDQIESEGIAHTRYSQFVSVCLVDLRDQSLIYDESDPVVRRNAALFEPPIDVERVDDCVALLRAEYLGDPGRESVALADVVDATDFDSHVVKRAFDRVARDGEADQLYVDDVGLALHFA